LLPWPPATSRSATTSPRSSPPRSTGGVEQRIYKLTGIDPAADQTWGSYLRSILAFSAVSVLFLYGLEEMPQVRLGGLVVDLAAKRVIRPDGPGIRLTPTEWHLLEVLLRHPGKLMSQRQLLAEVWAPATPMRPATSACT
jgi:hypothetical protein